MGARRNRSNTVSPSFPDTARHSANVAIIMHIHVVVCGIDAVIADVDVTNIDKANDDIEMERQTSERRATAVDVWSHANPTQTAMGGVCLRKS